MLPSTQARANLQAAEATYRDAARAYDATPEANARYRAAMESLIAAYDTMRLMTPRA